MLTSKTVNRGQAFVNIINIRQDFEKHARRLMVSVENLYATPEMEKKSVVTKSASTVSIVRRSRRQMNKEAAAITKENISVKGECVESVRRTVGIEKRLLKINKDGAKERNLINQTSTVESSKKCTINKCNRPKKKSGIIPVGNRKSKEYLITKKAVNFDNTSNLVISTKRLRKPTFKCCEATVETPKRVPIYKKDVNDSDIENKKYKKDIYKFTDEFMDRSDVNLYDKETAKIMTMIEKAEKTKAKNILKINKKKQFKKQPVTADVEIIFNTPHIKTYSTKCSKTTKVRNQILADVIVHATEEPNLTKETSKKESLSAFDKLKSNETRSISRINQYNANEDEIQEMNQFNSTIYVPECLTIRNTSPLLPYDVEDNLSSSKTPIRYTSHIDIHYDRSNNFGFDDDDDEAISPEKMVLIHLNEVSRKLQKRTPWRNRLIVRNKRILTVKTSSLPNVDQELLLDSTIVQKLSSTFAKLPEFKQTKLDTYFEANVRADLSTLFDSNNLSPIKPGERMIPLRTRNILQSKNQRDIIEINSDNDNSYFGFVSPVKNTSKENVHNKKSPLKLPMRIDSVELKRFKKTYVNKKRQEKTCVNDTVEEIDVSDELTMLGLFDELLEAEPVAERVITKKRHRKEDDETTDRICQNKKRRHQNELSEFNKWAEKFNKMCKEVEKHELFVE